MAPVGEEGKAIGQTNATLRIKVSPPLSEGAGSIEEVGGAGFVAVAVAVCVAEATVRNNNDDSSRPCIL